MPEANKSRSVWTSAFLRKNGSPRGSLDDHLVEVVLGTTSASGVKLLAAVLHLALSVVLARTLGANGAGIFFLAFTVTWIAASIARLGIDNIVLRQIAVNVSLERWRIVQGVSSTAGIVVVSTSAVLALTVFLNASWLAQNLFDDPDLVLPFRLASLAILPMALSLLAAEMIKGFKRILPSQLIQNALVPGFTALGVLVLAPTYGSAGAVWALIVAVTLTSILALIYLRRTTPLLRFDKSDVEIGALLHSSLPLFWYTLMGIVINNSGFVILGMYRGTDDVGIFGVAWRISMLISFLVLAAESIVAPKLAALHNEGDRQVLQRVYQTVTTGLVVLVAPILLGILLFPTEVLAVFGEEFVDGSFVLSVIVIGRFIPVLVGPVNVLLIMTGNEKVVRNVTTLGAFCVSAGSFLLVPVLGAVGAAIAVAAGFAINGSVAAVLMRKYLGFWPIALPLLHDTRRK